MKHVYRYINFEMGDQKCVSQSLRLRLDHVEENPSITTNWHKKEYET